MECIDWNFYIWMCVCARDACVHVWTTAVYNIFDDCYTTNNSKQQIIHILFCHNEHNPNEMRKGIRIKQMEQLLE